MEDQSIESQQAVSNISCDHYISEKTHLLVSKNKSSRNNDEMIQKKKDELRAIKRKYCLRTAYSVMIVGAVSCVSLAGFAVLVSQVPSVMAVLAANAIVLLPSFTALILGIIAIIGITCFFIGRKHIKKIKEDINILSYNNNKISRS